MNLIKSMKRRAPHKHERLKNKGKRISVLYLSKLLNFSLFLKLLHKYTLLESDSFEVLNLSQ